MLRMRTWILYIISLTNIHENYDIESIRLDLLGWESSERGGNPVDACILSYAHQQIMSFNIDINYYIFETFKIFLINF